MPASIKTMNYLINQYLITHMIYGSVYLFVIWRDFRKSLISSNKRIFSHGSVDTNMIRPNAWDGQKNWKNRKKKFFGGVSYINKPFSNKKRFIFAFQNFSNFAFQNGTLWSVKNIIRFS